MNNSFVLHHRVVVDGIHHPLHGLTRHDVDVPGEEHATARTLAHRLDEGVLDLREVARSVRGIRIDHDLGGADQEERIVSGERVPVNDDRTVRVGFLCRLEAGGVGHRELVSTRPNHIALLVGQAEGVEVTLRQVVRAHEHSNAPGVQGLAECAEHGGESHVADADVAVVREVEPFRRAKHLVHHGERTLTVVVIVQDRSRPDTLAADRHAIGLTIRHDHQGRDLNVVGLNPVHHELGGNGDRLNRGSATQTNEGGTATGSQRQALVEVGEEGFAGGRIVPRGGESDEFARANQSPSRTLTRHLRHEGQVVAQPLQHMATDVREAEHLERDLGLLTEPHQLENLKEAVLEAVGHRPAEVKEEHDAVVLAVLLDDLADEDVIVGAVLVQLVHVQQTRLLGTFAADLVRCLAAFKLGDQLAHERIGLLDELPVLVHDERGIAVLVSLKVLDDRLAVDDPVHDVLHPGEADGGGSVLLARLGSDTIGIGGHLLEHGFRAVHVTFGQVLLVLLHDLLHLGVLVESLGDRNDLRERDHVVDDVRDPHLVRIQGNVDEAGNAPLEVHIQLVEEGLLREVHLGEGEHIGVHDLLVAKEEVAARTGVLVLHQLLNANVLNRVGDPLKERDVEPLCLCCLEQFIGLLVGSPQGVADLVGDQHGLKSLRHIPHGQDEVAGLGVERCRFSVLVEREREVFGCECLGEDGERGVHARIVTQGWWLSSGKEETK